MKRGMSSRYPKITNTLYHIKLLNSIYELIDQSPLGSAAGFGVPVLAIDKKLTADLMGFSDKYNELISSMFKFPISRSAVLVVESLARNVAICVIVAFLLAGVPDGSSIIATRSSPATDAIAPSAEILISAIV